MSFQHLRSLLYVLLGCCFLSSALPGSADAHWLTKLLKEAGEAGQDAAGTAGRLGVGKLDDAASLAKVLPKAEAGSGLAFAAHVTPEGHWKFVTRDGEAFTAATPDEMARAVKVLVPDADADAPLSLYLTEDSVFRRAEYMSDLPSGSKLHLLSGGKTFKIEKRATPKGSAWFARARGNILVSLKSRADFSEALWQLDRGISKADVRVLSLKPGGPGLLPSVARRAESGDVPVADVVDPAKLSEALSHLRGQTVLITGRVKGDVIDVIPSSGSPKTLSLTDIRKSAAAADVNLIVLHSANPLQPGAQNWLWQTVTVDALDQALKKTTFGDFVDALAGRRGELVMQIERGASGNRVRLEAIPKPQGFDVVDSVGSWVGDAVSEVAGNVVTEGVSAFVTSKERQKELNQRIVPGVPSDYQFYLIAAFVMGLLGWRLASGWFERVWPKEDRQEYRGRFGYLAARAVRGLVFLVIFLPLVGPIALLGTLVTWVLDIVLFPWRLIRGMFRSRSA